MHTILDTWLAAILFLGETFFASSIIANWPLAVSMPPTKVCPQCKAAIPVRRKTCEHCDLVSNEKQSVFCERKQFNYETYGSSSSVKSARKAKGKLHKACERASETRERTLYGQEQNNVHGKHERVTRQ